MRARKGAHELQRWRSALNNTLRRWRSGQSHLTVNQATYVYGGSNPSRRTVNVKTRACLGFFTFTRLGRMRTASAAVFGQQAERRERGQAERGVADDERAIDSNPSRRTTQIIKHLNSGVLLSIQYFLIGFYSDSFFSYFFTKICKLRLLF
jgi:hypothetical protein